MSKFIKVTLKATGLPLVMNASLIETMIPLDGYTSIRVSGMPFGEADHVLESVEEIEAQLLRDEFAGVALLAILSNPSIDDLEAKHVAHDAYLFADAMLKERLK